jgi:ABC-type glycerol-3-phosphate transport system substrate-binding protein
VVLLALPFLAFAAGGGETSTTMSGADPVTIAVRDNFPGVPFQDFAMKYMEDHTRTKITWIRLLPDELQEKLNLLLASGQRPEIVQFNTDDFEFQLTASDLLQPLNDLLNSKMPNLRKVWGEAIWKAMTHPDDGKIYAIPTELLFTYIHFTTMYRKDWLDKLGMKVPATVDEYYNTAVAMAQRDPDGNGKKDTYAFGGVQGYAGTRYFDHVFSAFGTHLQQWLDVNGKLANGYVLPGAKEGLKLMRRLYEAGAIDPEFITDDETRSANKVEVGRYGAPNFYVFMFDSAHRYYKNFRDNSPNGSWVQGTAPLTATGVKPIGQRMLGQRGWLKTAIIKGSKNIDAAARIIDWLATDEGALYYNFGIPGEDHSVDANGKITLITPPSDWQKRSVQQIWLIGRDMSGRTATPEFLRAVEISSAGGPVPSADEGLIVPERQQYEQDLNIFAREQFAKMTVGEIAIDPGFDQFVQQWNSRGGKALTDALNKKAGR